MMLISLRLPLRQHFVPQCQALPAYCSTGIVEQLDYSVDQQDCPVAQCQSVELLSEKKKIQVALLYSTMVACYLSDTVSYIAKTYQLHIIGYPTRLSDISHHSLIFTTFVIWECDIHQNIATCCQRYHAKMRYIAGKPDISHDPTTGQNFI